MDFIEIRIKFSEAEPWKDVLASELAELDFDSFADGENENELCGYVREDKFQEAATRTLLDECPYPVTMTYTFGKVISKDWNEEWEAHYESVQIGDCYIRAPFHAPKPEVRYEIVIEPKMSFGTAHHETTSMMIEYLLEEDVAGKSVLDMGAGTGVLAILTCMKKAAKVVAVDNDEWAYRNNLENAERNHADMEVRLGDASAIQGETYDVVIANINRNILLNDIPSYAKSMHPGSILFLSGFYTEIDLPMLQQKCAENGLEFVSNKEKNRWCGAKFIMK